MIMKHATTDVFLNHYLSTRITTDTQAVVRGLAPQDKIMEAACRMSRHIDPNRPRFLTEEQKRSIAEHPRIKKLQRQLAKSSHDHKRLQSEIKNEKQRLTYHLRLQSRKEYDRIQAEKDIEIQLSGGKFEEMIKTDLRRSSERSQQHMKLIESIMSLPGSSLLEEIQRRSKAIRSVADYCPIEEGETSRNHRVDPRANYGPREAVDTDELTIEKAKEAVNNEKRPQICFICLGNDALNVKDRTHRFSTPGDLTKHFKHRHLKKFNDREGEKCNLCRIHLGNVMAMQRHAFDRHGTLS